MSFYPHPSAALFDTWEGIETEDPVDYADDNTVRVDAEFYGNPVQRELRNAIAKHLEAGGIFRIYNGTGGTLTKGRLLYLSGFLNVLEAGDTAAQASAWVIRGATLYNTFNGVIYWELTNSGTTRTVKGYKSTRKHADDLVCSGSRVGDGSITLTADNTSGITGSVTVAYTTDDTDVANTLTVNLLTVAAADANDPDKLADVVIKADLNNATAGQGFARATVTGLDTSGAASDGTKTYLDQSVSGTAGAFVHSKPSGDYAVQEVGTIEIDHATEGSVHFYPGLKKVVRFSSAMIGGTSILDVGAIPKWYKITVTHTQLQTAGLTNNITLAMLPAGTILHGVKIKQSTAFAGAGITAYTVSVGIASDLEKYAVAFDVLQAVADAARQLSDVVGDESHTSTTALKIAAIAVGANLDQSSAGSVDVWLLASKAV